MYCLSCLVLPGLALILGYWYLTRIHDHWRKQRVPSAPGALPIFGHMLPVIGLKESIASFSLKLYRQSEASMLGFFFMGRPALLLRDPELVKSVLQSNFSSFRANLLQLSERTDPVLAKNPFFINEPERWKETRSRIGNHLSGRKLRGLFLVIERVVEQMRGFTDRKLDGSSAGYYECELKDYSSRCTGEVVANAAFAIQGQSFEDEPEPMSFTVKAKTIFEPTTINGLKQALLFYLPGLARLLGLGFLQGSTEAYFRENISAVAKLRRRRLGGDGPPPNDFLQCCLDANPEDDIDSVIADAIIFYTDVYETSSATLSILLYQLSRHQPIQDELRRRLTEAVRPSSGEITYDNLKGMSYLDQVLQESMRIMAPVGATAKACVEPIRLTGSDGLTCEMRPGDVVFVPIAGLQTDERHWPEPDRFDPDRFAPENESRRTRFAFLPFSEGPRMCIGMRLAVMLVKLAAASLVLRYRIELSPKTRLPLEMEPTAFITYAKGGLWARFSKIDS